MKQQNDHILKDVLKAMVQDMNISPKLHEITIKKYWLETMGTTINHHTKEIKIRRNMLYLTIDSAPLRQELAYGKEKLLEVLNKALGEDFLEEIVVR